MICSSMNDRPSPSDFAPTTPPADPAVWAQEVLRRQVVLLEQLAEEGLRLGQAIARQITEPDSSSDAPVKAETIAMAFSRVARAVRMTALLQTRLLKDMDEARARAAFDRIREGSMPPLEDAAAEEARRSEPAYVHKARVEAIVERVAKAHAKEDDDKIDRIVREAGERLDDEDIYGDVLTRPVGELVAMICRDLGLDPDWTRLAEEAWAHEEIRLGVERSPFLRAVPKQEPSFPLEGGRDGMGVNAPPSWIGSLVATPPQSAFSSPSG